MPGGGREGEVMTLREELLGLVAGCAVGGLVAWLVLSVGGVMP